MEEKKKKVIKKKVYTFREVQKHAQKQGLSYREAKAELFDVK